MMRSFEDRILGGVAGGLGESSPLSAWFWRVTFVLLTLATPWVGPLGPALYVGWWWLLPQRTPTGPPRSSGVASALALLLMVALIALSVARDALVSPAGVPLAEGLMLGTLALVFFLRQWDASGRRDRLWGALVLGGAALGLALVADVVPPGLGDWLRRAWPLALIFFGLSVLLRDRLRFGGALALVVSLALGLSLGALAFNARVTQFREDQRVTYAETLAEDVLLLQVNVETLTSDVEFLNHAQARQLSARFIGSHSSILQQDYSVSADNLATFTLREAQPEGLPPLPDLGRGTLRVELPEDVALAISYAGETGDATFNLGALNLERLNLDLAEGDALVRLPDYQPLSPSVRQEPGRMIVREGNLTLFVPESVGGRFVLDRDRRLRPEFDDTEYILIDDGADGTLEARQYELLDTQMQYTLVVPQGLIRLEVD